MSTMHEFHYRLPERIGGHRHGSHPGSSLGAGQEFVSHVNLYDRPDPRRLDLRASLRNVRGDWLVRVYRQRAGVPVHVVVDVSSSMSFGARRPKLQVVAEFVEALGRSAFRVGDALGMLAFDAKERGDLFVPALLSRGMGQVMASMLERCETGAGGIEGLEQAALHLAGREGLVFVISDFHWPLDRLGGVLDLLAQAYVVPMIVWDPAELEPPARDALAALHDAESGVRRTLWMRPTLRLQWREAVARRRMELDGFFAARSLRPFYVTGAFDGEAMSRYFFEASA
jgi:uncharacterized protein (DUF58 family)